MLLWTSLSRIRRSLPLLVQVSRMKPSTTPLAAKLQKFDTTVAVKVMILEWPVLSARRMWVILMWQRLALALSDHTSATTLKRIIS